MDALALPGLTARLALLVAGLLVPGAAWMRALRVPCTVATSFAGSAVAIYATVLGLQLASVRISLGSLAVGLGIIAAGAYGRSLLAGDSSSPNRLPAGSCRGSPARSWLLLPYALFWIAVLWRAGREPLAGPDIEFRWSFLAEQMLRIGSLDFYPPQSARDFLSYFWAESIPPGVSSLHAWAYACAGANSAPWTIPAVLLQVIALHELLWRTATNIGGARAGLGALFAAAACPLLTWSMLLGQETGFTTLAAVGIVFGLEALRREHAAGWAALVGVFAVVGASAREYGVVFPFLAVAGLWAVGADRRAWISFVAVAALALVWPLRTWLLTANPFYSLVLDGLPTNARFIAWIEHDAAALGAPLATLGGWLDIARYVGLFAPTAFLGWCGLAFVARRNRDARHVLIAIAAILVLWTASVRYTNGGLFYSLRVTSPALALGALAAGVASGRSRWAGTLLLLMAVCTLPATLALPQNPLRAPWREWPAFAWRTDPAATPIDETVALILRTHAPGTVLADSPGFQRRFLPYGVPVIPLWSPQADWLFDASLPPAEAIRRWRESGVRHVIITKWQRNLDFFNTHARWGQPPFQTQLVGETTSTAVFRIVAGE